MVRLVEAGPLSGLDELLRRLEAISRRIAAEDHIGAMHSLRYWDRGYDLRSVPPDTFDAMREHSFAARVCLSSGDGDGAANHVRSAAALAAESRRSAEREPLF